MKSILVVEDEPAIADTVEYAFATEGFSITRAVNAREATEALCTGSFSLALISHGIPKESVRLRWKSAIQPDFRQITLCARHDKKCLAPRVIQIAPFGRNLLTPSGR